MTTPESFDVIDSDQASTIFAEFASSDDFVLGFPQDGCYARAHLMVKTLGDQGLVASKIWAFAADTELLWTEPSEHPEGRVEWHYHVAPMLPVRATDGDTQETVFDPILFDQPTLVDEWVAACTTHRRWCEPLSASHLFPHAAGPDIGPGPTRSKALTRTRPKPWRNTDIGRIRGTARWLKRQQLSPAY